MKTLLTKHPDSTLQSVEPPLKTQSLLFSYPAAVIECEEFDVCPDCAIGLLIPAFGDSLDHAWSQASVHAFLGGVITGSSQGADDKECTWLVQ
jgi:hypothetical protein